MAACVRTDRSAAGAGAPASGGRVVSLDGLRGVAALVVLVHHSLLTWPALAGQYNGPNRGSGTWWLTFTPLHLVWAGTEAVVVFFVLSGIVLTRPFLFRRGGGWPAYYGRRLLRLYLPVIVSVGLSGVLVRTFPRRAEAGVSWWFAGHDVHVTPSLLAHDALIIDGCSWANTVLWSLRYEVTFSLLLPLVILVMRRWPASLWLNLPLTVTLVGLGQLSTNPFVQWLPYFAVGVAVAAGWDDVRALADRIEATRLRGLIWGALWIVTGVLLLSDWWVRLVPQAPVQATAAGWALVALGAALLCFLTVTCPLQRRICSGRFLQWIGGISYSLYLVHEPIVVSVSSLAGPGRRGVATTVVVGGAIALGVATLFHRMVERPSQRWARAAGAWLDRRLRPRCPSTGAPATVPAPRGVAPRHAAASRGPVAWRAESDTLRHRLLPVPPPNTARPGKVLDNQGSRNGSWPVASR